MWSCILGTKRDWFWWYVPNITQISCIFFADCLQIEAPSQLSDNNVATSFVLTNNLDVPDRTNNITINVTGDGMVSKLKEIKLQLNLTESIQCHNNKEVKVCHPTHYHRIPSFLSGSIQMLEFKSTKFKQGIIIEGRPAYHLDMIPLYSSYLLIDCSSMDLQKQYAFDIASPYNNHSCNATINRSF